jgi:hypothetical protein
MSQALRRSHIRVASRDGGLTMEPCEENECHVTPDGVAVCGSLACPACGHGGDALRGSLEWGYVCMCGHFWKNAR